MFNPRFGMADYGMAHSETSHGSFSFPDQGKPFTDAAVLAMGIVLAAGGLENPDRRL
ncbi:MAG: hypothetical protein LBR80_15305 [Deltaproteobacteria bacterium]|jgi:hypothetical protein|nr:hypothetical protein [Deltaproteobacteria bacterium]